MIIIFPAKHLPALAKLFLYAVLALIVLTIFMEYWYFFVGLIVVGFVILVITAPDPPPKPEEPPVLVSRTVVNKGTTSNPEELSQAQKLLNTFRESEEIVNESNDIAVVDSRYSIMMNVGSEISKSSIAELIDVQRHFVNDLKPNKIFRTAAQRFVTAQVSEISRLKTEAEKQRRIEKIEFIIDGLHNMPQEIKTYSKRLLRELLHMEVRL